MPAAARLTIRKVKLSYVEEGLEDLEDRTTEAEDPYEDENGAPRSQLIKKSKRNRSTSATSAPLSQEDMRE